MRAAVRLLFLISINIISTNHVYAQKQLFTLKIKSKEPWPNSMAFLHYIIPGKSEYQLDSALLVEGEAVFNLPIHHPQKASVYIERANMGFIPNQTKFSREIYLEAGQLSFVTTREVGDAILSGTPLNNDLQGYQNVLLRFKPYRDSLRKEFGEAYRGKVKSDLNRLSGEFRRLDSAVRKAELRHFKKNLNSIVSLEWLEKNINIALQKKQAEELFRSLSAEVRASEAGMAYSDLLKKISSVSIGDMAPDFKALTPSNLEVSLKQFKGKYVLLDFWASWCAPCRAENPNILKAYRSFQRKDFTVLGFSMDDSKQAWEHAIKADNLPWTQVSDLKAWNGEVSKVYGIEGIPTNFLIDPQGKIIARDLRGTNLIRALEKWLDRNKL